MRTTTAILAMVLLVSGLSVSEAQAYGGGGFYGSGHSAGISGSEMKTGWRHRALGSLESYPGYLTPFEAGNYLGTSGRDFEMPPSAHGG